MRHLLWVTWNIMPQLTVNSTKLVGDVFFVSFVNHLSILKIIFLLAGLIGGLCASFVQGQSGLSQTLPVETIKQSRS